MASPGWSTTPSMQLFPGAFELPAAAVAGLPPELLEAVLAGSRRVKASVVASLEGRAVEVPVTGGAVSEDWAATPRTTLSLTVPAVGEWLPTSQGSLLHPKSGARLTVRIGVSTPRTPTVWFPYGVFVTTRAVVKGSTVELSAADLSHPVRGRLLTGAMTIHPGLDPLEQAGRLLARRAPWVRIASGPAGLPVTASWLAGEVGGDPWEAAQGVLKAAGAQLFFDPSGELQAELVADPIGAPVAATWTAGPNSVIGDVTRSLDGADAPDGVIVMWQGGTVVVPEDTGGRLAVWAGDPATIADADAARAAGEADLLIRRGALEQVTLTAWARYGLHVGDVVAVDDPATGTSTVARVARLGIPLDGSPMQVTLADRRVTA